MLSVKIFDVNGNEKFLGSPLSITLEREEDVPADSLNLSLAGVGFSELVNVEVYCGETLVFSGEVDETIEVYDANPHTEIVARNSTSRLIDNEAYPMSFVNPSAQDIFDRYAKPFGFKFMSGENRQYNGRFTVSKGSSCFSVIKRFANEVYGSFPKCDGDVLYMQGIKSDELLFLGGEGIPVQSMKVVSLRCNRVSRVFLKLKDGEGYNSFVSDIEAEREGINKIRYVNIASGGATLKDADGILEESKKKGFYAEAVCRGFFADSLGKSVIIDGKDESYYVSSVRYISNEKAEYTKLRLLRKEE